MLIGNTDKRGRSWHYREGDDNHYPRFIPVGDVERRLFAFDPVERQVATLEHAPFAEGPLVVEIDGERYQVRVDEDHKAIVDPDHEVVFNYPTNDFQIHNYRQWLLKNVATILDDDLGITSAGLLRRRAQAGSRFSTPSPRPSGY